MRAFLLWISASALLACTGDLAVVSAAGSGAGGTGGAGTTGRGGSGGASCVAPSFAAGVEYPTGWNPRAVAAADLDGDGKPDLAVASSLADDSHSVVSVLSNHGHGTL